MFHSIFRIFLLISVLSVTFNFSPGEAKQPAKTIQTQTDEEAFLIRRIAEFWKDGDFAIVKNQVVDFLDKYPESSFKDYFLGILGDIYLQENNYTNALSTYQLIKDPVVYEKILLNKLQCYYELDMYHELAKDGNAYIHSKSPDIQDRKEELYFLMGEAFFRNALQSETDEEKTAFAHKARDYYENLPKGQYKEISEFAVAEIYAILGEHEKGAAAYRELAKTHSHMQEDLFFQVASLEAKYNTSNAIDTFKKVKEMEGKRANEATFNLTVLLFQNEDYEQITDSYATITKNIPEDYMPAFNFIVGKSFFSIEQYQNAIVPLQKYVDSTYIPSDQLKNALLIQMTCAHQINDETLFNHSFNKLDSLFPDDQDIPKALFMHAMLLKEQGLISKANEKLKMIKDNYTEFENQESFIFEYGFLAHQDERWQESYDSFKSFVTDFKDSVRIDAAWKLFLSSALNLYKHSNEENYSKTIFFQDLHNVLAHHDCLNDDEMKSYSLLYAKMAYELNKYSEALCCLQDHIFTVMTQEENPITFAEAHFISGLCYAETETDYSTVCMHLEKAILLNPELYDSPSTHLQLYNAYISLAGYGNGGEVPKDEMQKKEFLHHAAKHLEEVISRGSITIKEENRLWLANYYYQTVKEYYNSYRTTQSDLHQEIIDATDRACSHYRQLLFSNHQLIDIHSGNLYLEYEIIKLAKLFAYQNDHQQKLVLLKQLLEQQSEKSELNWMFQNDAFFELAITYTALGEKEKAFETYSFIHVSANHFPTVQANQATFEKARIHFELLDKNQKNERSEEVLSILNDLKELQIRKNVNSEPIHLEAALEYAKIRSLISDKSEQDSRYLFFLERIKDDFTSQEDPVTQNYLAKLHHSSKKEIFDAYMKFIDAEKLRLEANNFYQKECLAEMEELHDHALTLYGEIKNNPNIPCDLFDRISGSIQAINALNAY